MNYLTFTTKNGSLRAVNLQYVMNLWFDKEGINIRYSDGQSASSYPLTLDEICRTVERFNALMNK